MTRTSAYTRSFAGGEMSPDMLARIDDARQQQGLGLCRNFITLPSGAAYKRGGLEFVRSAKNADKFARLIPFVYSTGQAVVVECGEGYFRFHTDGATLLHVTANEVASVDTSAETITFTQPHGWTSDMPVRFFTSGTIPTNITAGTTYYAIPVDTHTVQVSASSGPGAAVNIASAGVAPIYGYEVADCPTLYVESRPASVIDMALDRLTFASAHGLATGDAIEFTLDSGTADANIVIGTVYYAIVVSPTVIQIADSYEDAVAVAPVDRNLSGLGLGVHRMHRAYTSGDLVTNINVPQGFFSCTQSRPVGVTPGTSTHWHQLSLDGVFEIPNDYEEADLRVINYAQSGDVLTLVHQDYPPSELQRRGATNWSFLPIEFNSTVDPPAGLAATATTGAVTEVASVAVASPAAILTTSSPHGLAAGQQIYLYASDATGVGDIATPGFYIVGTTPSTTTLTLRTVNGGTNVTTAGTGIAGSPTIRTFSMESELFNYYLVTAEDEFGQETDGQTTGSVAVLNNLLATGAFNTVTWTAVPGASRYRVYKALNGTYGYIGTTTDTTFVDDRITPSLTITLPRFDVSLSGVDYPGAVAFYEDRRVFGGTPLFPQTSWLSRTGLYSDLSYHVPLSADDRISFTVNAREAATIRHLVPLQSLIALTSSAEVRIVGSSGPLSANREFFVNPQSYIGCSTVHPVVVGGTIVFVSDFGGHVYEMGYRADEGYLPGNLSYRATHLFGDGRSIVAQGFHKAPVPVMWFPRSDGVALGLTYAPEEQIGGWHQHTTDGEIEDVCCIPDGGEYRSYFLVKRTVGGSTVRYIERMASSARPESLAECHYLDSMVSFSGVDNTGASLTITRATNWSAGSSVTIVSTLPAFRTGSSDEGDIIQADYGSTAYRFTITSVTNGTTAVATIVSAVALPTATTNYVATVWGWLRDTVSGLDHLEGEAVTVIYGSTLYTSTLTVSGGAVTLPSRSLTAQLGLPYTATMRTLPFAYPSPSFGQNAKKNPSEVWIRRSYSGPFEVGPDEDHLVPVESDLTEENTMEGYLLKPGWTDDGTVTIVSSDPYPLRISSITTQVSIGG